MDKILINDLLKIPDCDIGKTRLKLNVFNGNTDPLEEYKKDPDKINIEWFCGTIKEDISIRDRLQFVCFTSMMINGC